MARPLADAGVLPEPVSLTHASLDAARELVSRFVPPTPQNSWPLLDAEVGSRVTVKHENHTPVGAFKVRGGLVYVDRLVRERPEVVDRGIVSATRGNHGQSLAFAGRAFGVPVTIYVPHGNSVEKNAAMRGLGAEVVEFGGDFQEAREECVRVAEERGLEAVPPFHPDLVAGVATYAHELFTATADDPIDTVYVPIGMGSGVNAVCAVRDLLGLDTDVVAVVSSSAPASQLSFDAGEVVTTDSAATFVDGVATRSPDPTAIAGLVAGAARVIAVDDDAVAEAMRMIFRTTHNVAESAGAIALAGLISESPDERGAHSAFVLCGGNVDTTQFHQVLGGATPSP
ncbi:MAG: threonine dehydratase [Actinomycetota bacterium]